MNDLLMSGFPPSAEGQVILANWRKPPFNRWAFSHVCELVPSAPIRKDDATTLPFETGASTDLGGFRLEGDGLDFQGWLDATYTDALLIVKNGRIIHETYAGEMDRRQRHILMSVSKSVLGLVAGILEAKGIFDPKALVTAIIPEVAGTAYEGATLRDLLDMRVGLRFDENYQAAGGPIIEYRKAQSWDPLAIGEAPKDLRGFFANLTEADGAHDDRFHYASPNTDLLGWVIERLAGKRYADLVSELIWQPMGAEEDAYITVDRLGAPRCAGGFCASLRDLARLARLFATKGRAGNRQVLPEAWINDILTAGDADAWNRGDFIDLYPGASMHYRSKWYVEHGPHPMVFGLGVFGQNVFVEPDSDLVIAKFSSQPVALEAGFCGLTHRGVDALRALLR